MENIVTGTINQQNSEIDFDGEIINTGVIGASKEDRIFFTKSAIEAIHHELVENDIGETYFIRLATRSMGCLGMQFKIGYDSNINDDDRTFEIDNIKVVVDSHSLFYFMAVTIDFVDDINGSGFVFHNPHTQPTCGCSH